MTDYFNHDLFIFDLDDTLINTRESYHLAQIEAVKKTFPHLKPNELDACIPDLKWFCKLFGSGNPGKYFSAFLKNRPTLFQNSQENINALLEIYNQQFWSLLTCFKNAHSFLHHLKQIGKIVAIASNGIVASQQKKLNTTGLNSYFSNDLCFISGDFDSSLKKPSPFLIQQACQQTGIPPEHTIFFGNIVSDMVAGKLAGATTVYFGLSEIDLSILPDMANPDMIWEKWPEVDMGKRPV